MEEEEQPHTFQPCFLSFSSVSENEDCIQKFHNSGSRGVGVYSSVHYCLVMVQKKKKTTNQMVLLCE